MVTHGVNGFLAEVGDVDAMAKHAVALGRSVLHLDLAQRRVVVHGG